MKVYKAVVYIYDDKCEGRRTAIKSEVFHS